MLWRVTHCSDFGGEAGVFAAPESLGWFWAPRATGERQASAAISRRVVGMNRPSGGSGTRGAGERWPGADRSDDRPVGNDGVLWDDHDAVAHVEVGAIELRGLSVGRDPDVVADPGVLVHDRPLDDGPVPDAHRRRACGPAFRSSRGPSAAYPGERRRPGSGSGHR